MKQVDTLFGRLVIGALFLSTVAAVPASIAWLRFKPVEEPLSQGEVTVTDEKLAQSQVVWVDARTAESFQKEHVPGAILLNEEGWEGMVENVFKSWQPGMTIVAYCDAGCSASSKVAGKLRDLGFDPVYVLRGGFDAWKRNQH